MNMNIITIEHVNQWVKTLPERCDVRKCEWASGIEPYIIRILSQKEVFADIDAIEMFRDKIVPHIRNLEEVKALLNKRLDDQVKQLKTGKKPEVDLFKISKNYIEEIASLPDIKSSGLIITYKHQLMDAMFRACVLLGNTKFADMAAYEAFMKLIWPCRYDVMNEFWVNDMERRLLPKIYEELKQKTLQVNVSEKQRMN